MHYLEHIWWCILLQAGTGIAELIALEISKQVTILSFQNVNVVYMVSISMLQPSHAGFDQFIDKYSNWRVPQEGLAGGFEGMEPKKVVSTIFWTLQLTAWHNIILLYVGFDR